MEPLHRGAVSDTAHSILERVKSDLDEILLNSSHDSSYDAH